MTLKKIGLKLSIIIFLISGCNFINPAGGDIRISETDTMEMVYIPAGEFMMGSTVEDLNRDEDEEPSHTVYLEAYWIDKTEVTNAMFGMCIASKNCQPPAQSKYYQVEVYANHPIIGVSWEQANAYCAWAGRRLPTEAEWEKAARGMDGRMYPWGNDLPNADLANFNQMFDETQPVGSYPKGASPYGVLDMAGNAWEWVADGYSPDFYSTSPFENPLNESPINQRVLRGGNWNSNVEGIRSANRFWAFPNRNDIDGFRCAKSD